MDNHQLHPRTSSGSIDFLRVPKENVVDLRPRTPPPKRQPPNGPARTPAGERRLPYGQAARFFGIALMLILPFLGVALWQHGRSVQGRVLGVSTEAYAALTNAAQALQALDVRVAQNEFAKASTAFQSAHAVIGGYSTVSSGLAGVLPIVGKVRSGDALVRAGEQLAVAGAYLTAAVDPMLQADPAVPLDFPTLVNQTQANVEPALAALERAADALATVRVRDLPDAYRSTLSGVQEAMPQLRTALERLQATQIFLGHVLGSRRTARYLMVFQNNLELRATGGFIGSVALMDVANGTMTKLEVPGGGSYDFQGQLSENILAPQPLWIVNPRWQLQDANWWPDFPTSARKIVWFYEKSGGPTVDGVIALTPDLIIALLKATGPIDLTASYGTVITAENFLPEVLSTIKAQTEHPKQIIGDLLPPLMDKAFTLPRTDPITLLGILENAVTEKQLLFYFPDAQQQQAVSALGWAGELRATDGDYLSVVDTNIGGGKTDGVIDETIEHRAAIADDGSVTVRVTVTRSHFGAADDPITGTRNVDYIRFYVPKGSTLMEAEGFERIDPKRFQAPDPAATADADLQAVEQHSVIEEQTGMRVSEEFDKTVFSHWIGVGPGETARATVTYRLPKRLRVRRSLLRTDSDEYSVLVQQQPGVRTRYLVHELSYPERYRVRWASTTPAQRPAEANRLVTAAPLVTDLFLATVFDPA